MGAGGMMPASGVGLTEPRANHIVHRNRDCQDEGAVLMSIGQSEKRQILADIY